MRPIVNMLVELATFAAEDDASAALLTAAQVSLENQRGITASDADWIAVTFGGSWPLEAQAGWNWLARDARGKCCGFATYEQRLLRYWWLTDWLDKPDVGIFGPMGVDPALRGQGLGKALAQRALLSLKQLGFARALIPAVGPVEFYERCCGARVAQRLER